MDKPEWTEEEERILRHEALVTKALELRGSRAGEKSKPIVLLLLESSGVTALITVVLGGIIGQLLLTTFQNNSKKNEQALTEYKQYLDRQQNLVQQVYDLVGRCMFDAQSLIDLTQPRFKLKNIRLEDRKAVVNQRQEVLRKHNALLEEWNRERGKLGLLMSYYSYGQPSLVADWNSLQAGVDDLLLCSKGRYREFQLDPEVSTKNDACKNQEDSVREQLKKMANTIEASKRYAWQQLSAPQSESPTP